MPALTVENTVEICYWATSDRLVEREANPDAPMLSILFNWSNLGAAIMIAVLGALFTVIRRWRPEVVWGIGHTISHRINCSDSLAHTQRLVVSNVGLRPAKHIELLLKHKPQSFVVSPSTGFDTEALEDQHFIIRLYDLAPGETRSIEMMEVDEPGTPEVINVHYESYRAQEALFTMVRAPSKHVLYCSTALIYLGCGVVFYALVALIAVLKFS